jgi:hypothetical protein
MYRIYQHITHSRSISDGRGGEEEKKGEYNTHPEEKKKK